MDFVVWFESIWHFCGHTGDHLWEENKFFLLSERKKRENNEWRRMKKKIDSILTHTQIVEIPL